MRYLFLILIVILLSSGIIKGCLDNERKNAGDHVWKEQTDTIKKAEDVNQLILDAAEKQRLDIEQQSQ